MARNARLIRSPRCYQTRSAGSLTEPWLAKYVCLYIISHSSLAFAFSAHLASDTCDDLSLQMAFHTGLTLSQSAYPALHSHPSSLAAMQLSSYLHHRGLASLEDDPSRDPARPMELVCIVLRAGMLGMVKTLGLTWDELVRGNLYEVNNGNLIGVYVHC